eukprot:TRINITY_DN42987_c0_g1_i1.p1 TRINITY_DN42987_c0_g1~~TRINITY_DN42987_c0_g1_i1.p1  ORF type:complete len:954 (+),score=180.02 TRINITY_DN42987_c0_g1_i1:87-2948(+)
MKHRQQRSVTPGPAERHSDRHGLPPRQRTDQIDARRVASAAAASGWVQESTVSCRPSTWMPMSSTPDAAPPRRPLGPPSPQRQDQPDDLHALLRASGLGGMIPALEEQGVEDTATLATFTIRELQDEVRVPSFGDCRKLQVVARKGCPCSFHSDVAGLRTFLSADDVRLSAYESQFLRQGIDSPAALCACSEEELKEELGMAKIGHRRRLRLRLDKLAAEQGFEGPPSGEWGATWACRSPSRSSYPLSRRCSTGSPLQGAAPAPAPSLDSLNHTHQVKDCSSLGSPGASGRINSPQSLASGDFAATLRRDHSSPEHAPVEARNVRRGMTRAQSATIEVGGTGGQSPRPSLGSPCDRSGTRATNERAATSPVAKCVRRQRVQRSPRALMEASGESTRVAESTGTPGSSGCEGTQRTPQSKPAAQRRRRSSVSDASVLDSLRALSERAMQESESVLMAPLGAARRRRIGRRASATPPGPPAGSASGRTASPLDVAGAQQSGTTVATQGSGCAALRPLVELRAVDSGDSSNTMSPSAAGERRCRRSPPRRILHSPPRSPPHVRHRRTTSSDMGEVRGTSFKRTDDSGESFPAVPSRKVSFRDQPPIFQVDAEMFPPIAADTFPVGDMLPPQLSASLCSGVPFTGGNMYRVDDVYEEVEEIGSGAFGTVVRAVGNKGGICAIKKIDMSHSASVEDAKQEFATLRDLQHENIVQVCDCFVDEKTETVNIIMEYMANGSVHSMMEDLRAAEPGRSGRLEEGAVRAYTFQTLQGLQYLHNCSIVHSDIKPRNLLVGQSGEVKLADFGLSRHVKQRISHAIGELAVSEQSENKPKDDSVRALRGTVMYMSPRLVTLETNHTFQSDVWALGCTVLEMATGTPPWHELRAGGNDIPYIRRIASCQTTGETPSIPGYVSASLRAFILMCFAAEERGHQCRNLLSTEFLSRKHAEVFSRSLDPAV